MPAVKRKSYAVSILYQLSHIYYELVSVPDASAVPNLDNCLGARVCT
jgi:hypothetical protein